MLVSVTILTNGSLDGKRNEIRNLSAYEQMKVFEKQRCLLEIDKQESEKLCRNSLER